MKRVAAFQDLRYAKQATQTDDAHGVQTRRMPITETGVNSQIFTWCSFFGYTATIITYHLLHSKDKKINSTMDFFCFRFLLLTLLASEVQLKPELTDTLAILF
jgi:hypothetical protein